MHPTARRTLRRFFGASALTFILGLALFAIIRIEPFANADERATRDIHSVAVAHPVVRDVAKVLTMLGNPVVLTLLVAVAAGILLNADLRARAGWLIGVTGCGAIVETVLKLVINRTRPAFETVLLEAHGTSFPSGHAMNTSIVLGALALVLPVPASRARTTLIAVAAIIAVGVGATRTLVGVHYLSDIVAGYTLAVVWLSVLRTTLPAATGQSRHR